MHMTAYRVKMTGINKAFPGVIANDNIDLAVKSGEIQALLGENGAGKSTLMKILAGSYQQDSGDIYIDEQLVLINSPSDALNLGIGMVYQHFMLVESMTVLDNFLLGLQGQKLIPNRQKLRQEFTELAERYALKVSLDAYIWQLSVGEQQRIEILRLLHRGANVLILDEPTAVLTPPEAVQLGEALRQMAAQGKSVLMITHKLDEVMQFADHVTVLRSGKNVATVEIGETNPTELARLMLGREVSRVKRTDSVVGEKTILSVQNLKVKDDRNLPAIQDISFEIKEGEILGIAGVAGNGQRELTESLTGLRSIEAGRVLLNEQDVTGLSTQALLSAGMGYVPEDRLRMGTALGLSISDNLILKNYYREPLSSRSLLNFSAIRDFAKNLVSRFNVSTPGVNVLIKTLSGGNIQKVILAREISTEPDMIIIAQPTRGLDIGAAETIHRLLLEQRKAGKAVLLSSEDLDELLLLSDRIIVLYAGKIMGTMLPPYDEIDALGLMMAGVPQTNLQDAESIR